MSRIGMRRTGKQKENRTEGRQEEAENIKNETVRRMSNEARKRNTQI